MEIQKNPAESLCECGCGQRTTNRYARGHNRRGNSTDRVNEEMLHYIRSSLLGDGYLSYQQSGKVYYGETHSNKFPELIEYVRNSLGTYACKPVALVSGKGFPTTRITTRSFFSLKPLREEWYPQGIKIIPDDLSWFDDFSMAKWLMDDGSIQGERKQTPFISLASQSFSKEEQSRLLKLLQDRYGITGALQYSGRGEQHTIRLNAGRQGELESLWKSVAPFIIPSLSYKLPAKYRECSPSVLLSGAYNSGS
jgi:hypothetical protein